MAPGKKPAFFPLNIQVTRCSFMMNYKDPCRTETELAEPQTFPLHTVHEGERRGREKLARGLQLLALLEQIFNLTNVTRGFLPPIDCWPLNPLHQGSNSKNNMEMKNVTSSDA